MQDAFNLFDVDKKGSITIEDMQNAMVKLDLDIAYERIFVLYDKDRDNELSFEEFCNILKPIDASYMNRSHSYHSFKR